MTIYRRAKCKLCGSVVIATGRTLREVAKNAKFRHDNQFLQSSDGQPRSTCDSTQFDYKPNDPIF